MESESYRWHYDYTRLAWESGFCFESHKSKKAFDRNAIAVVDIERIIRERDIAIVEKHVENILEYNLDPDELKILDPNFVKLFRLGKLSVEFLIYCKKYLDKTVVDLKSVLQQKTEENEFMQKEITKFISENSKLKKRIKDLKTTLYYTQKNYSNINEQVTIYQCHECGKAFVNNEYLNAHLKRRHHITDEKMLSNNLTDNESPTSADQNLNTTPEHELYKAETDRLQSEIKQLKEKLNNAERYFNPDNKNVCVSPEHGTVKIHNECYHDIKGLQQQFSLLKTQVESELELLKTQKLERDKYDHWIQNVFSKIDNSVQVDGKVNSSVEPESKITSERRNSYTQTEDAAAEETIHSTPSKSGPILVESVHNSPVKTLVSSPQRRLSIQKVKERASHFIKRVDSPTTIEANVPDMQVVQEQVEKKWQEKTKQEIEQLGEQLTEKMSSTFNKLEERMESFWNKLNEIQTQNTSKISSPIVPHKKDKRSSSESEKSTPKIAESPKNETSSKIIIEQYSPKNLKSTESETDSQTESNRYSPSDSEKQSTPTPRSNKMPKNVIEELRTKVEERKTPTDVSENVKPMKRIVISSQKTVKQENKKVTQSEPMLKTQASKSVETPVVKKVFSQPVKYSTTESETETSESETESSTQTDIKSENIKSSVTKESSIVKNVKNIPKKSVESFEKEPANPENLQIMREEILDSVSIRLRDLGIDPKWKTLPNKAYKQKSETAAHQRALIIKKNHSFSSIREGILEDLEIKVKHLSESSLRDQVEVEQKPSKFKSLLSNVKSKAKLLIRSDKTPTKSSPIYRLTVHRDLPQKSTEKIITPRQIIKREKAPEKKGKIVIKPKKMYIESDEESESDKSDGNKEQKAPMKNKDISVMPRKSRSITSLDTNISEKSLVKSTSIQNITQSISNLDSILEMKKEVLAEINAEDKRNKKSSSSDISISEEISKKNHHKSQSSLQSNKQIVQQTEEEKQIDLSDLDSEELKIDKMQKSVLKNYPSTGSLVKKKVLFDLESDGKKTESESNVKKTLVKSRSFLNFDKDDDSSSVASSVFDGSKTNLNQSPKEKISTKAIINVPAKSDTKKESESDWDISDI